MERILCLGDLHLPYCSKEKVRRLLDLIPDLKPSVVVQLGDLYDMASFSRFPKSIKLLGPSDELSQGRIAAEEIWQAIRKRCPKAKLFQLKGNHCDRPYKKMLDKCPELEPFTDFSSMWKFNGVNTVQDSRDMLLIEDIAFFHGYKTQWLSHVVQAQRSVCFAHTHRGGCLIYPLRDKMLFELNAGYLADPYHEALLYRDMKPFCNWTHGFGFIDKYGARFITL